MSENDSQLEPSTPQPLPPHPKERGAFGTHGPGDTSGFGGLVRRVANPANLAAGTPRPYGSYFDGVVDTLSSSTGDAIEKVVVDRDELTVFVARDKLLDVVRTLRDDPTLRFEMCLGVNGVHYPDESGRELHAVYPFLSITHNRRLRLKVFCEDDEYPLIDSVTDVWASANWFEREAFDLYGIVFEGHADLRRILTDYGFIGHPMRKDFPTSGHVEMRYDPEKKRVIYQPVTIEPREITPRVVREDHYGGLH